MGQAEQAGSKDQEMHVQTVAPGSRVVQGFSTAREAASAPMDERWNAW